MSAVVIQLPAERFVYVIGAEAAGRNARARDGR